MSCFFGHKFSHVEEDGYQYCSKCGKAVVPPQIPCAHDWVLVQNTEIKRPLWDPSIIASHYPDNLPFFIRTYECSKCKALRNERIL
jgi:hypothetical protein